MKEVPLLFSINNSKTAADSDLKLTILPHRQNYVVQRSIGEIREDIFLREKKTCFSNVMPHKFESSNNRFYRAFRMHSFFLERERNANEEKSTVRHHYTIAKSKYGKHYYLQPKIQN